MQKFFLLSLLFISFPALSQHDSAFIANHPIVKFLLGDTSNKDPGLISLNVSQTALSDWQGGGENNFAITTFVKYDPIYKRNDYEVINKIDAQYGLIKTGTSKLYRKNVDRLFAMTKVARKAFNSKYWFYSLQADFRTQFGPGYTYINDSIAGQANSDFISPGYLQLALGLDLKVDEYFTLTFAPIAGKATYVNRQHLADEGAFGVEPAVKDSAGNILVKGKKSRYEFGGRFVLKFKKDLTKQIFVDSYVDLFSNYLEDPQNIDVVINNSLIFKVTKYFNVSVISQLLYDHDVKIKRDFNKDGLFEHPSDVNGPRMQALTTVAFGLSYKFR